MRLAISMVLLFLVIFPVFSQEDDDWYYGRPIRRVVFEGLNNIRVSDLEGITEPFIGRIFTDESFWDLLGRLYSLEFFDDINSSAVRADPEGTEVVLRFIVVERPVISRINFIGNNNVRRNDLLDIIISRVNNVSTPARLRIDELAIVNRYLERGYPSVRVSSEVLPGPDSTIIVEFHIDEGERIVLENFLFEGNTIFSARTLRGQMSSRTRGIFIDGAFQEARLALDRLALIQYYHDRGYIDAQIIDEAREIRQDERGNNLLTITFSIYEGNQFTFGGITFENNHIFSDETLSALVTSRVGESVNDRRLRSDLERIAGVYYENGYIFNRIEPVPIRDTEAGTLSFNIIITERGRAHIENIIIRGNERTRDSVILREIPLEPGDIFSQSKIIDGLRNLHNLQYFSMIIPETPPGSADSLMDLVINVEETTTSDIQFGLTFTPGTEPGVFPISAVAQWNDRNFLGSGNIFGTELNLSPQIQNLSLSFTHRWFMGLPLDMSYNLSLQHTSRRAALNNSYPLFYGPDDFEAFPDGFSSYQDYINSGREIPDEFLMNYNQWSLLFGIGTGYRWLTPLGNLGLGGGFRIGMVLNSYDSSIYRPFDPVLREGNNVWRPSISIWSNLTLDRRDIFFDPSSGYYGSQRAGIYGILPGEHEYYIRTDTKLQWFYTLFDLPVSENWNFKAVFGVHTGLSFIFPQPGRGGVTVEEANRLALDGMFIGRGWQSDYSNKGLALWENWMEVRIPLAPGLLSWDFFFDVAGVKKTPQALFSEFSVPDDTGAFFLRFSYGGGIRFTISQFPLRFSLARRFKVENGNIVGVTRGAFDFVVSFALSTY